MRPLVLSTTGRKASAGFVKRVWLLYRDAESCADPHSAVSTVNQNILFFPDYAKSKISRPNSDSRSLIKMRNLRAPPRERTDREGGLDGEKEARSRRRYHVQHDDSSSPKRLLRRARQPTSAGPICSNYTARGWKMPGLRYLINLRQSTAS